MTAGGILMQRVFTLKYWEDEGGWVGRLKEVPGVFSQGASVAELEVNIRDAYHLVLEDELASAREDAQLKDIEVEV
jgi:predicted RNase H-like HicB family nuclease